MLTYFVVTVLFAGAFVWWGNWHSRQTGIDIASRTWFRLVAVVAVLGLIVMLVMDPADTALRMAVAGLAAVTVILLMALARLVR